MSASDHAVVLLPCPYCGDEARLREADALEVWYVDCTCCGARQEATTRQRAIAAWNNRRANGFVNWLESEMEKASGASYLDKRYQSLKDARKMVKRLLGQ